MADRTCLIEGCGNPPKGRGWCAKHYSRWQRYGDPLVAIRPVVLINPADCVIDAVSAQIPVRWSGTTAVLWTLVDPRDLIRLLEHRWHVGGWGYVLRNFRTPEGTRTVHMHREVLGAVAGDGKTVDHINRDKLDNRRANLRIVPAGTNQQNMGSRPGSSSQYRGVYRIRTGKWGAHGRINGHRVNLGTFVREEDAAATALRWRRENMPYAID